MVTAQLGLPSIALSGLPSPFDTIGSSGIRLNQSEMALASAMGEKQGEIVVKGARPSKDRILIDAAENAANSTPRFFNSLLGRTAFGWLRGILIHSRFAANIRAMNNPMYSAEVSYLRGEVVPYGTPGSTRVDAVVGNPASPLFAIDLKTGAAVLGAGQLSDYRNNIPPATLIQQIIIP